MASDAPWNVRGLAPEVRETAREAARRSGLTTAEWLQSVIIDSAAEEGVAHIPRQSFEHDGTIGSRDIQALDARLAALSQQLEWLARTGAQTTAPSPLPAAAASEPAASRRGPVEQRLGAALRAVETRLAEQEASAPDRGGSQPIADAPAPFGRRREQLATDGRSASSELESRIAAVDRALATLNWQSDAGRRHSAADWWTSGTSEHAVVPTPETAVPRSLSAAVSDRPQPGSSGIEDAMAEIAARRPALEIEDGARPDLDRQVAEPPARLGAAPRRPTEVESNHLSRLEHQLRQLTGQLETLRAPGGFQQALAALRSELADIGRKLTEAVPRRALQALEAEVRTLVDRIDVGRHRGGDAATLANIERAVGEVRDALHRLAPAESLASFRQDVQALDHKIDAVAAGAGDAGALRQLKDAVAELREIASRAASGEALIALVEEVQALGDKIDRIVMPAASGDAAPESLDQRFAQLAAALEAGMAASVPPSTAHLIAIVETLAEKVERMEVARERSPALDQIAAQLARLTHMLEASGSRLAHLDGIERTLAGLFDQLESLHASAVTGAQRAAEEILERSGTSGSAMIDLEGLKQDLGALLQSQLQNDRRTQDTLEAVHDTLERLVDRLAMVDIDMRAGARSSWADLTAREPEASAHLSGSPHQPETRRALAAAVVAAAPAMMMPPARRPIDPTLPADHPLEPGTARQRPPSSTTPASAAERIAASDASRVGANPAAEPDSKANFIAAARRAAQAAATLAPPASRALSEEHKSSVSTFAAIAQKLTRRGPLFLGVILLIAGALHPVLDAFATDTRAIVACDESLSPAAYCVPLVNVGEKLRSRKAGAASCSLPPCGGGSGRGYSRNQNWPLPPSLSLPRKGGRERWSDAFVRAKAQISVRRSDVCI